MRKKILLISVLGICVLGTVALLSQTMYLPEVIEDNAEVFEEEPTEEFLIAEVQDEYEYSDEIEIVDCELAADQTSGLAGIVRYRETVMEEDSWIVGFVDKQGLVEMVGMEGYLIPEEVEMVYEGDGTISMEVIQSESGITGTFFATYVKDGINITIDGTFVPAN